jgi:hypothetical protein
VAFCKHIASTGCITETYIESVLIIAEILTVPLLALVWASSQVSARRIIDYPNYGYCPGSNRVVWDVSRCRAPGPYSGQCPPGKFSRQGRPGPGMSATADEEKSSRRGLIYPRLRTPLVEFGPLLSLRRCLATTLGAS